jgi:hypothetical protein
MTATLSCVARMKNERIVVTPCLSSKRQETPVRLVTLVVAPPCSYRTRARSEILNLSASCRSSHCMKIGATCIQIL